MEGIRHYIETHKHQKIKVRDLKKHLQNALPHQASISRYLIFKILKRGLWLSYKKVDTKMLPASTQIYADMLYEASKVFVAL